MNSIKKNEECCFEYNQLFCNDSIFNVSLNNEENKNKYKKLDFKIFSNGYLLKTVKLKPLTCGLIIENSLGWFLGHVSGQDYWDLPKGKMDLNEDPKNAAIRECLEETGLDLSSYIDKFEDMGTKIYNKKMGKSLKLFKVIVEDDFDLSKCFCKTKEMDQWGFFPKEEISLMLNRRMGKQLLKRGLLEGEIRMPDRVNKVKTPILLRYEVNKDIDLEAIKVFKNKSNKTSKI